MRVGDRVRNKFSLCAGQVIDANEHFVLVRFVDKNQAIYQVWVSPHFHLLDENGEKLEGEACIIHP